MKSIFYIATIATTFYACGNSRHLGTTYPQQQTYQDNTDPITQSLFNDKTATISEENIQKILDGNFKLPAQLRIAIVNAGTSKMNNRYYWNDEQYLKTQQAYLDSLEMHLKQSQKVTSVATIPDLLLTKPLTYTNIREAAVRLQADVVIVYSITTDVYSKYKVFTKADIKAFATTQFLLLDVRTGLIPFSTIVTKDQLSKKQETELDNSEATNRIQKEAVLMTLAEIGNKLTDYLEKE